MRTLGLIIILICCLGCQPGIEDTKNLLTGYWTIEDVTMENGTSKTYNYSGLIDHYAFGEAFYGVKKKVQPQFSGRYKITDDALEFKLIDSARSLFLKFKNDTSQWQEEILQINKSRLKLKLENNLIYLYKRYQPLDINP